MAYIRFTLDGSDLRAPGGEVSAKAADHTAAVPLKPDARVFARARVESRWSPPARAETQGRSPGG